jgi:hypothetical protein
MDRSISGTVRSLLTAVLLLSLASGSARAATIPAYTVTDLGAGTAQLATDSAGNGVVISPDGLTSYAFPTTDHALSTSQAQAIIATLPPMTNAPVWSPMTYGNPNYAFSNLLPSNVFLNDKGVLLVTNVYGVDGHYSGAGSTVLTAQRQADGSFGPLTGLWTSPNNGIGMSQGQVAQTLGLNNLGQVLGVTADGSGLGRDFLVHDLTTGQTTNLQDLLPTWHLDQAIALDNQGRVLLTADSSATGFTEHSLLLTPLAVPEPTALATIVAGLIGLGLRHPRRHG